MFEAVRLAGWADFPTGRYLPIAGLPTPIKSGSTPFFSTLYATGVRLSEPRHLRIGDRMPRYPTVVLAPG
jgi:hypothetical protein